MNISCWDNIQEAYLHLNLISNIYCCTISGYFPRDCSKNYTSLVILVKEFNNGYCRKSWELFITVNKLKHFLNFPNTAKTENHKFEEMNLHWWETGRFHCDHLYLITAEGGTLVSRVVKSNTLAVNGSQSSFIPDMTQIFHCPHLIIILEDKNKQQQIKISSHHILVVN